MSGFLFGGLTSLAFALTMVACAGPEPTPDGAAPAHGLELRVERAAAERGDEVTITLVNGSEHDVGYNLCPAVLDRRDDEAWVEDPNRPAEVCTMELRVLGPGESAAYRHTVPTALDPGEYRFRVGVEAPLGGDRVVLTTTGFQVR